MKEGIAKLKNALVSAECILIGAGAGLSAAAGYDYGGARFLKYFSDFHERFGIEDIYTGGFYPFPTRGLFWAWWSRSIYINRYAPMPESDVYPNLFRLTDGHDYFVLTTNVDHAFQRMGFDKERLFYTQGDFGLFQSSRPAGASAERTYDNEEQVRAMLRAQGFTFALNGALLLPEDGAPLMEVPAHLIPYCKDDGTEMTTNLRADEFFVEDAGWHAAAARYEDWLARSERRRMLLLELGVGASTPGIIKYPFWRMTAARADVTFVSINKGMAYVPDVIAARSIVIDGDIAEVLRELL
jgi:SIR2 family protein